MTEQLTIDDAIGRLSRQHDPQTSHEAAGVIQPHLGRIQRAVLDAFAAHGAMTAREAERLPELGAYGFSTVRKRISELAREGRLEAHGVDRTGRAPCTIYRWRG